eukprot:2569530-Amphidinium_carterae.1
MPLAAAHKALGKKEKMRELYTEVFAFMQVGDLVDEPSTARARGIFASPRCDDAEELRSQSSVTCAI